MKKSRKLPALLLAFLGAGLASGLVSAKGIYTPEQVMGLYTDVYLQQNVEAAKKLNAYFAPITTKGEDYISLKNLTNTNNNLSAKIQEGLMAQVPEKDRAQLAPILQNTSKYMVQTYTLSSCKPQKTAIRKNTHATGLKIATVYLNCQVVNVPPLPSNSPYASQKDMFSDLNTLLKNALAQKRFKPASINLDLYEAQDPKNKAVLVWINPDLGQELFSRISDALQSTK